MLMYFFVSGTFRIGTKKSAIEYFSFASDKWVAVLLRVQRSFEEMSPFWAKT